MINSIPEHVAIILDGNRRFAKRLMLEPWKGHVYGAEKVNKLIRFAAIELGIKEMTFYCLSVDNINSRPENELRYLYRLFKKEFKDLDRGDLEKNSIRIKFIGNMNLLPEDLKEQCKKLEKETENNSNFIVNFALAYGGREEIIEAVRKIIKNKIKPEELNNKIFEENLYLINQPDLIIRTGGEKRTSNFLPWQSTYSEWIFLDKMWPEFDKEDFTNCLEEYKNRKRNFGR